MTTDLQRQFDVATAYYLAGERCSLDMGFEPYDLHSIGAPTITNYAFAVELALKLIHALVGGIPKRDHNLKELYEALPPEHRENLPHLESCVDDIARYFNDWRYSYEREFLVADEEGPRRAFIECYREVRRLRPDLLSVYEKNWGGFDPHWVRPRSGRVVVEARDMPL